MVAMHVMQPSVMDVVNMRTVLDCEVFLVRMTMHVIVTGNSLGQFFGLRVGRAHFNRMLINVAGMGMVKVAVMKKIDMSGMFKRLMTTALAVGMGVMSGMQHLVGKRRGGSKRECEGNEKQGSDHMTASINNDPAAGLHH